MMNFADVCKGTQGDACTTSSDCGGGYFCDRACTMCYGGSGMSEPPSLAAELAMSLFSSESDGCDNAGKKDELCIKTEELCIKNEELCIKNEELYIKNDGFAGGALRGSGSWWIPIVILLVLDDCSGLFNGFALELPPDRSTYLEVNSGSLICGRWRNAAPVPVRKHYRKFWIKNKEFCIQKQRILYLNWWILQAVWFKSMNLI